jgi:hypothetical protein
MNRTALEQNSQTGHPEKNIQNRIAKTGQQEYEGQPGKSRTAEQDIQHRTMRTRQAG